MNSRYLKLTVYGLCTILLAGFLTAIPVTQAQDKENLDLDKIPAKVMDGLKAKFPKAEINKCTAEKEGDIVVYDFEFKQAGHKFEADVKEDGTIHNWEKAVKVKGLPKAVKKAVETKYPKASIKDIMEITAVNEGKDALEGYEIVLKPRGKEEVEVMIAPDGTIREDTGEKKQQEK